jgi:hypothetical protein
MLAARAVVAMTVLERSTADDDKVKSFARWRTREFAGCLFSQPGMCAVDLRENLLGGSTLFQGA